MPTTPRFVTPCIPTPARTPPTDETWLHELQLDGYRFQIVKDGRQVRLYSRSGLEWTDRHQGFAATFSGLRCRTAVLDGELVLPANSVSWRDGQEIELLFFAFDILHRDDDDLRLLPFEERRRRLVRLVTRSEIPCLHLVQTFADGAKLLGEAERMELRGIVSKRLAAPYRSGRSKDWLRVKTAETASRMDSS